MQIRILDPFCEKMYPGPGSVLWENVSGSWIRSVRKCIRVLDPFCEKMYPGPGSVMWENVSGSWICSVRKFIRILDPFCEKMNYDSGSSSWILLSFANFLKKKQILWNLKRVFLRTSLMLWLTFCYLVLNHIHNCEFKSRVIILGIWYII